MDWPVLEYIAPELVEFRLKLQEAIDQVSRLRAADGSCPSCVETQYLGWEREWLQKLNQALNAHPHLEAVGAQFMASNYEHVARRHMENRLRAEAESKATQKAS